MNGPVVRKASVEYLLPVEHPDTVDGTVGPTRLGETSVTLTYEVRSRG